LGASPALIEEIDKATIGLLNGHRVPMGKKICDAESALVCGSVAHWQH
jgi:hypothetical protein